MFFKPCGALTTMIVKIRFMAHITLLNQVIWVYNYSIQELTCRIKFHLWIACGRYVPPPYFVSRAMFGTKSRQRRPCHSREEPMPMQMRGPLWIRIQYSTHWETWITYTLSENSMRQAVWKPRVSEIRGVQIDTLTMYKRSMSDSWSTD
jgi:hypothetical protein